MDKDFKATSDAISEAYVKCIDAEEYHGESWEQFCVKKDEIIIAHGWTLEEYEAAEKADQEDFYESLKYCSDCGKLRHDGFDCEGVALPPLNIIHMDGIEPEPEDVLCKFCGKETSSLTAHLHDGSWVGDECCWDERLKATE